MAYRELSKAVRKVWLGHGDSLYCGVFTHFLTHAEWEMNYGTKDHPQIEQSSSIREASKLVLFLGGPVVILHSCDMVDPVVAMKDFSRKMTVISDAIESAVSYLQTKNKHSPDFIHKRFLNEDAGPTELYTSTIAITVTNSHGITFEIGSCDRKSRITLGRGKAVKFLKRLNGLIIYSRATVDRSLENNRAVIEEWEKTQGR